MAVFARLRRASCSTIDRDVHTAAHAYLYGQTDIATDCRRSQEDEDGLEFKDHPSNFAPSGDKRERFTSAGVNIGKMQVL